MNDAKVQEGGKGMDELRRRERFCDVEMRQKTSGRSDETRTEKKAISQGEKRERETRQDRSGSNEGEVGSVG